MGRRLIDTDAAYAVLTDYYHHTTDTQHAALKEALGRVETVDAVPVVHGHWIKFGVSDKDGNQQYRCSVCECEDIHSPLVKVNYCWNCGARMDGKDGEGRE